MKWPNKKYKIGENHLCRSVFFVTQISQMRPVRSLQIPPESGKCPTDFTDIHRFFHRSFLSHRFHRYTQIFIGTFFKSRRFRRWRRFFLMGFFIHRISRNLFGGWLLRRLLTDFRRCDLSGRCRYPLRLDKEIHQRFHKNLCKSVKSVGKNNPHEEKSASSAKSAWPKQQEHI